MFDKAVAIVTDVVNVVRGRGSWKTGVAGIIGAVVAVLTFAVVPLVDGDPATGVKFAELVGGVALSLGVYVSRDDDKSDKEVGAK